MSRTCWVYTFLKVSTWFEFPSNSRKQRNNKIFNDIDIYCNCLYRFVIVCKLFVTDYTSQFGISHDGVFNWLFKFLPFFSILYVLHALFDHSQSGATSLNRELYLMFVACILGAEFIFSCCLNGRREFRVYFRQLPHD